MNIISDTVPKGDIFIKYGEPLDIYCIINENAAKSLSPNASSKLLFVHRSKPLNREMVSYRSLATKFVETVIFLFTDTNHK